MTELVGCAPGRAETARRVALPTLAAITASVLVASVGTIVLSGDDVGRTLTVGDLWRIVFPISLLAPALVCPVLALHMACLLRELRRTRDELVVAAQTDPLTGLLNRRGFDLAADRLFSESRRSGQPVGALMCDIDLFKAINDRYGHEFGDLVLKGVADVIRGSIGARAAAMGRQGGEEFAILLPGADAAEAAAIAETVRGACAGAIFRSEGVATRVTLSIGVASRPAEATDPRTLLGCADAALFQAKRDGRNRVVAAAPSRRFA